MLIERLLDSYWKITENTNKVGNDDNVEIVYCIR